EKCLKRDPGNASVLNNLAVSLASQKKYGEAAKHWKAAATTAPEMKALSQNIGSLITLAGSKEAKLPGKTLQDLSSVYEELITKYHGPRPTRIGFVYAPPRGVDGGGDKGRVDGGRPSGESVVVSSGTGFVVAPHLILPNRHVVDHATGVL